MKVEATITSINNGYLKRDQFGMFYYKDCLTAVELMVNEVIDNVHDEREFKITIEVEVIR